MNILVVEDEEPKLAAILKFLGQLDFHISVEVARSVKSGLTHLQRTTPDLLILDMSLPTFDISGDEPGGRPQGFGGIEIVRYVDSEDLELPTIVVSAYEAFSKDGKNIELTALASELANDYPGIIRGVVYFNPIHGSWSEELARLVVETQKRIIQ